VSGTAGLSTYIVDSTNIRGALTADSERQLVVSYIGGACDASARGEAIENGPSITVHVLVTVLNGVCTAQGIGRTAVATLSAPWGNRVVLDSSGAKVPVVDGALVLSPSWVPAEYQGGEVFVGGSDSNGTAGAIQYWTPPDTTQTPSPGVTMCRPTTAAFTLWQGYTTMPPPYPLLPNGQRLANGTLAKVDRDDKGDLGLYWTPPGHPADWTVSLQSEEGCTGYQPLSLDTLLKIANGLH
jgi:hypothetical protein